MIEANVALSTLASVVAPPPPPVETTVRVSTPDQASSSTERSSGSVATRYFRFNLKYDAVDQQLYFVFKNPVTGSVVDEAPSVLSVRSPLSFRATQHTEQVFNAGARGSAAPPSSGGAPASSGSSPAPSGASPAPSGSSPAPSAASTAPSGPKPGAPAAPGVSAAPAAPGASAGGDQGRGSAIDSRI